MIEKYIIFLHHQENRQILGKTLRKTNNLDYSHIRTVSGKRQRHFAGHERRLKTRGRRRENRRRTVSLGNRDSRGNYRHALPD